MATAAIDFITDGYPAPGLRKCQRLITGHGEDGKGHFLVTDAGDHHRVMGEKQAVAVIPYSTKETPVELNDDADMKFARNNEVRFRPLFSILSSGIRGQLTHMLMRALSQPGLHIPHGSVIRVIDFGPGLESPLHRAMSIDYGVVLEGEFELTLDSGESRIMRRGDVSVQRATAHKWRNITAGGTEPGRMMWVLLDCKELFVGGEKVEGFLGELEKEYEGRSH